MPSVSDVGRRLRTVADGGSATRGTDRAIGKFSLEGSVGHHAPERATSPIISTWGFIEADHGGPAPRTGAHSAESAGPLPATIYEFTLQDDWRSSFADSVSSCVACSQLLSLNGVLEGVRSWRERQAFQPRIPASPAPHPARGPPLSRPLPPVVGHSSILLPFVSPRPFADALLTGFCILAVFVPPK